MTQDDFINNFAVSDEVVKRFQTYLNIKESTNITFVAYKDQMKQLIKAALAEQLFGTNAAEEIMNVNDEMILEVIKLSSDKKEEVAEVVKTKKKS